MFGPYLNCVEYFFSKVFVELVYPLCFNISWYMVYSFKNILNVNKDITFTVTANMLDKPILILILISDTVSNTSLSTGLIKYYHFVLVFKIKLNVSSIIL